MQFIDNINYRNVYIIYYLSSFFHTILAYSIPQRHCWRHLTSVLRNSNWSHSARHLLTHAICRQAAADASNILQAVGNISLLLFNMPS